jgi:hypothetical protein
MATVTTIDSKKAIIRVSIMTDYISEMIDLLDDLKKNYEMKEIADDRKGNRLAEGTTSTCSC